MAFQQRFSKFCTFALFWLPWQAMAQTPGGLANSPEGFALVELFTSQGCSSCPAADAYLADLGRRAEERGEVIITLSFHVDYWDYLGWADPYAQAAFTQRQRAYGKSLDVGRIFTPQMVINGRHSLVGSDRAEGNRLLKQCLAEQPPVTLSMTLNLEGRNAKVHYQLGGKPPRGSTLNLVWVQEGATKKVLRGENRGRELRHHHVVRALETWSLGSNEQGLRDFALPKDLLPGDLKLLGFVQQRNMGAILAAAMVELP